jgi:hypothetical protein
VLLTDPTRLAMTGHLRDDDLPCHPLRTILTVMDNPPRLQLGSQVRCPHCRRWHLAIKPYAEGTDYTRAMLFVECRGGRYYAGQAGQASRWPIQLNMKGWNADESRDQKMAVERETRSNAKSQHYGHVDCIGHCEGQRRITCYEANRFGFICFWCAGAKNSDVHGNPSTDTHRGPGGIVSPARAPACERDVRKA